MEHNEYLADGIAAFEAKEFRIATPILSTLAEQGNAEAQFRMAVMQQNGLGMVVQPHKAFDNMQKAAEQHHPLAMHSLGFMYYAGECADKNLEKARHWFLKAADHGLQGSMMMLATIYKNGEGVEQDNEQANYWEKKSYEQ
jgi:uncharacterized protein